MIIEIRAKPGAKKEELEKVSEGKYTASLKEKAEDNKANFELLRLLKKHFGKEIKMVKGLKSRNKIARVG
ncbi:hypothetical protein A3K73_00845 [Candidatus Pacearchaeota archaeon RBG_13_36_9]|nr:MAG: hypothetical protein A3K73_00845 [Candidatus Pacearchaeota archaeon RBG_13_36_9]